MSEIHGSPARVLIANRGEIALRIIRAAHSIGWEAVAVFSDVDEDARWVELADDAVHIGASPATKSYLNIDAIISAAKSSGCTYVHPGYGFLAERPEFSRRVAESGLTFVGPAANVIEEMGDKALARRTAERAGVPIVPGTEVLSGVEAAAAAAEDLGYPVLVKASAGGGGKGTRVVADADELREVIPAAQAEARSAFGDPAIYLEKAVLDARHIEVQILGDTHGNVIHVFERDCSVQRRRQKLIEEAPAPGLAPHLREAITSAAVRLVAEIGYEGAGTVEFIVDGEEFYFIEMNTRIQVEHPITEEISGIDLVAEQLHIAAGRQLSVAQEDITIQGAAIQFRINAENPQQDFFPSPGTLTAFDPPGGPGVRVDAGVVAGGEVPPYYDSLVAKIIVHGRDREAALARGAQALSELHIDGILTTRDLHLELLRAADLRNGPVTTNWLENTWLPKSFPDSM